MRTNDNINIELLDYCFLKGSFKQKHKLKLVLTYFSGIPKLDIREYYLDVNDEQYKPTKRGVQLDPQKAEALRYALEQNSEIIDQHLLSEDLAIWVSKIKKIESESDFFSNYEFFKIISNGNIEKVIYNKNHPFGKKLDYLLNKEYDSDVKNDLLLLLNSVLIAYQHTLSHINMDTKIKSQDLVDDINIKWNSLLRKMLEN